MTNQRRQGGIFVPAALLAAVVTFGFGCSDSGNGIVDRMGTGGSGTNGATLVGVTCEEGCPVYAYCDDTQGQCVSECNPDRACGEGWLCNSSGQCVEDMSSGGGAGGADGTPEITVGAASAGGQVGVGNPGAEICDGTDNDGNGKIDDLDAAGDGICDCLNVATIGKYGQWSAEGASDLFKTWLSSRGPRAADDLNNQILTRELLDVYDIVIVLDISDHAWSFRKLAESTDPLGHTLSPSEISAFAGWLEAGGGAMTTIGYTSDEPKEIINVNNLLSPHGVQYDVSIDVSEFITDWDTSHPIGVNIENIRTDNGVSMNDDIGTTVARDADGDAVLQVIPEVGKGRMVIWGDEWITYDSEWADIQDQQVEQLWLQIFNWLAPKETCDVAAPPPIIR